MTDKEFLKQYNPNDYERPSVTTDILIFTISKNFKLQLLLIKRKKNPFIDKWAIPGGFVNMDESLEEGALRELKEETGVENVYLEQLYTFGNPSRDPRMRVISVAYLALVSMDKLQISAGDDASEAILFDVERTSNSISFVNSEHGIRFTEENLAFDHKEIIRTALKRLEGKLDYSDIIFEFLENKDCFTLYELRRIYECITGEKIHVSNFRRDWISKYIKKGVMEEIDQTTHQYSKRAAKCFKYNKQEEN